MTPLPWQQQLKGTPLSRREHEVLCLAARGFCAKTIANLLTISIKTVEKHRQHSYYKFGVNNIVDATHMALHLGLIQNKYAATVILPPQSPERVSEIHQPKL